MDYYIYISVPKLATLFSQLPKSLGDSLGAEVSASVGVLSAKLKTNSADPTIIRMVTAVEEYIEREYGLGTINSPKEWVKSSVLVRPVLAKTAPDLFGLIGQMGDDYFLIGGSAQNVIGASGRPVAVPLSYWPYLAAAIVGEVRAFESERNMKKIWVDPQSAWDEGSFAVGMNRDEIAHAIRAIHRASKGPELAVEFLARHLTTEDLRSIRGRGSVFTPLYVKHVYTGRALD